MKRFLAILGFVFVCGSTFAQSDNIEIIQDPRIDQYMAQYEVTFSEVEPLMIYRIKLVSTYERDKAYGTQTTFRSKFPYQTFLTHDGVKFEVRAGRFETKADAEDALLRIKRSFPSAFLLPPEPVEQ